MKEKLFDKIKRDFTHFKSDFIAGLIVAIVALPLAIGFSIASGVPPVMGIYAAIVGGLFDPRMGVIDRGKLCKTCHKDRTFCTGHPGYIQLVKSVYMFQYI